jgi:DNA mismatch repair ATPase MutS
VLKNIPIRDIPPNELFHHHNAYANYYECLAGFEIEDRDELDIDTCLHKSLARYLYSAKVKNADQKWVSGSYSNIASFLLTIFYVKDENDNYVRNETSELEVFEERCIELIERIVGKSFKGIDEAIKEFSVDAIKIKASIFDKGDLPFPADIYSKVAK